MFTAALIFIAFICILLIFVVLLQSSKSGGGAGASFGSSMNYLVGANKKGDLLENITWGLAITLLVSCLATNFIIDRDGTGQVELNSVNVERAQESGLQQQPQQQPAAQPAEQTTPEVPK